MAAYTQGLMDLGATVCVRATPQCDRCPLRDSCVARQENRQAELPTPKVRKTAPERRTGMLVLQRQGRILLEQRPSPGIWGGLWSLPEFDADIGALAACRDLGVEPVSICQLAAFSHTFTHFRLHISPWYATVAAAPADGARPRVWVDAAQAAAAALPAPVRKLVEGLFDAGLPERVLAA
jgi:A/G-specific adenine glycosylase